MQEKKYGVKRLLAAIDQNIDENNIHKEENNKLIDESNIYKEKNNKLIDQNNKYK